MLKEYGYTRISTPTQSIDRQVRNIKALYPDAEIVKEAYTGTKIAGRAAFEGLLKQVERDIKNNHSVVIIFDSVSRMSRDEKEGFELYQRLYELGVELVFLKEPHINTSVYREALQRQLQVANTGDKDTDAFVKDITEAINRFSMRLAAKQIELAFIQSAKEVNDLHQRTKEGLLTARLEGRVGGRKAGVKINVRKKEPMKEKIRKYSKDFEGSLSDKECMEFIGIARNTYYKYKKELKEGV
jgi:DNA invertase Pin-like site-specific DNA recombinase